MALPQDDIFDRIERAASPDLRIHRCERFHALSNTEQAVNIREKMFQGTIEDDQLTCDFLTPASSS